MMHLSLPNPSLRTEEKRNLLLRIKYGYHFNGINHSFGEDDFIIEGHSMVHRPRKRMVPKLPDYGRKKFFKSLATKSIMLNIGSKKLVTNSNAQSGNSNLCGTDNPHQQKAGISLNDTEDVEADQRFAYINLRRGSILQALHEHEEDENGRNFSFKTLNRSNHKKLPDIPNLSNRKMSISRRYSRESDTDYKKSVSRSSSFSSYTSDKFQTKTPLSRRRTRRWKNKNGDSRRSSKNDLQDFDIKVRYKLRESLDEKKPKHLFFDYPGFDLTFVDVQEAIEKVIPDALSANKVLSIQFENVNVKRKQGTRENRWHIELQDFATKDKLLESGLEFRKPKMSKKRTNSIKRASVSRN